MVRMRGPCKGTRSMRTTLAGRDMSPGCSHQRQHTAHIPVASTSGLHAHLIANATGVTGAVRMVAWALHSQTLVTMS
jgi:hypothetical protein